MNRQIIKKLLFACIITIATACGVNSKDSYLESFNEFIVNIEKKDSISQEELTFIKKNYLDYTETYYNRYKEELTDNEKKQITKLKTRYYSVMTKQGLKDFGNALKDLGEQANEFINSILE